MYIGASQEGSKLPRLRARQLTIARPTSTVGVERAKMYAFSKKKRVKYYTRLCIPLVTGSGLRDSYTLPTDASNVVWVQT